MQETQKPNKEIERLENQSSTLGLLVTTVHTTLSVNDILRKNLQKHIPQLEVLAALQGELLLGLAGSALQAQDDLLGGLGLLVEDGLGLTTVTTLLPVVTTLTLGEQGGLSHTNRVRDFSWVSCFFRFGFSPCQPCTG